MAGRLMGKWALVTGAASGLGLAISRMFVAEGARVLMTDINAAGLEAAAALGQPFCRHDVTDIGQWEAAVAKAETEFGGLHILVNNAGIGVAGSVEECTLDDWRKVHAVDLDSVFLGCKLALPLMARTTAERGERGSILNVSSIAGIIAAGNMAGYNSAKAAVRHLSKSVALHCAKARYAITSNSIHPAFIDTPILDDIAKNMPRDVVRQKLGKQIPLGHVGDPTDVAYAAVYLCSDEAKFVTGAELYIDGGIAAM
jgi:NAD(P)-dependent dehydrogenase (short-subunit alcohol dehydrogenase family)